MYAMYAKQPDLCPVDQLARMGRNGYCLAMAMRDPTLCWGAKNEEEEARCRAILTRDPAHCASLSRNEKQAQCRDEARRWASVITEGKTSFPPDYHPSFELTLKASNAARPAPFERVKHGCANQGIIVPRSGHAAKVLFCDFYPYGFRSSAAGYDSPESRTKIAFEFRPPEPGCSKVTIGADASLAIRISGFDEFSGPETGEIVFSKFERRRGGRVKGIFHVTLEHGEDFLEVEGSFDSFIRDLVAPESLELGPIEAMRPPPRTGAPRGPAPRRLARPRTVRP
jgi:hypothetical protein